MKKLCDEARSIGTAMVAVNSCQSKLCKELLKDTDIHVGAAIGFPLGQTTIAVKVFETEDAISSVTLEAVEFIPEGIGEGYGIQYFLNFNQGEQWYPIVPVSLSYQGICQYEINNGNLEIRIIF